MSKELTKNLVCIQIRGDIQIWVEGERAKTLVSLLASPNAPQFITYEERMLNRADIVGVFTAKDMAEMTHRKRGEWKCKEDWWHGRFDECDCRRKWEKFDERILFATMSDCKGCSLAMGCDKYKTSGKSCRQIAEEKINNYWDKYGTWGALVEAGITEDIIFEKEQKNEKY